MPQDFTKPAFQYAKELFTHLVHIYTEGFAVTYTVTETQLKLKNVDYLSNTHFHSRFHSLAFSLTLFLLFRAIMA